MRKKCNYKISINISIGKKLNTKIFVFLVLKNMHIYLNWPKKKRYN